METPTIFGISKSVSKHSVLIQKEKKYIIEGYIIDTNIFITNSMEQSSYKEGNIL
jgi:hypothetical protein